MNSFFQLVTSKPLFSTTQLCFCIVFCPTFKSHCIKARTEWINGNVIVPQSQRQNKAATLVCLLYTLFPLHDTCCRWLIICSYNPSNGNKILGTKTYRLVFVLLDWREKKSLSERHTWWLGGRGEWFEAGLTVLFTLWRLIIFFLLSLLHTHI